MLPLLLALAVTHGDPLLLREGASRCSQVFAAGKGHVAFLGGSITEMAGYRPILEGWLQQRFTDCRFTFTNAGIASTCSTTGAFRTGRDVLAAGPVDLLLVEFAVNDDQDARHPAQAAARGLEGVIRQVLTHNPNADVVVIYFVNPPMLEAWQAGKLPLSAQAHEAVATHYRLPSVSVGAALAARIKAGSMTWDEYGGVHPKRPGNQLAADLTADLLQRSWAEIAPPTTPRTLPAPLDPRSYAPARLVAPDQATFSPSWKYGVFDWTTVPGQARPRFAQDPVLVATEPGAELTLSFRGHAVGAYVLAGPDAGTLEVAVDGEPRPAVPLYHDFSANLHYPRTVMLATDLSAGAHSLRLRIAATADPRSKGHAVRLLAFTVAGE